VIGMPSGEVERMRIGELAEVSGTTARALRHYEQSGLISSERAPNGYRVYDERAAVRVRNIRHLLATGLTLDDVRVFLPCLDGDLTTVPPSDKGIQVALERLAVLDARIAAQVAVRDRLQDALRLFAGRNGGEAGGPEQTPPTGPSTSPGRGLGSCRPPVLTLP